MISFDVFHAKRYFSYKHNRRLATKHATIINICQTFDIQKSNNSDKVQNFIFFDIYHKENLNIFQFFGRHSARPTSYLARTPRSLL